MDSLTERGVAALRAGDRAAARALLAAAVRARPDDARAWLWLSGALDDPARQRACLERALALDPSSEAARRGLEELGEGRGDTETRRHGDREASERPGGGDPSPAPPLIVSPSPPLPLSLSPNLPRSPLQVAAALPWLASALAGVSALLGWAAWARLGEAAGPLAILGAAAVGGAPLGLAALLLGGVLLRVAGRRLGGRAGAAQVRAALGWAAAPAAYGLILWGAQIALLPAATFGGGAAGEAQLLLARACAAIHGGLWLWAAARSLTGLAAAHGISAGRAAASWLIAALMVAAGALAVLGCSALVIGLRGG